MLPGTERLLNFQELQAEGSYPKFKSKTSQCLAPCSVVGCSEGSAVCTGNASTAKCPIGKCNSDLVQGSALVSVDGSCALCRKDQYRDASGVCAACPLGCKEGCQKNTVATITSGTYVNATQYRSLVPEFSYDGNEDTYSEQVVGINPAVYYELNGGEAEDVTKITIWNRADACASRLFGTSDADYQISKDHRANVCKWKFPLSDEDTYDNDNGGFKVGVFDSASETIDDGTICGKVTVPLSGSLKYTVGCPVGTRGTHAFVMLPGSNRLLQIAEIQVGVAGTEPRLSC